MGTLDAYYKTGGYSNSAINNRAEAITTTWNYNNILGNYEIILSHRLLGAWSTGKMISSATQVYDPRIAMDNTGNAIVTWQRTFQNEIVIIGYRNNTWGKPWIIFASNTENSVAMNDKEYAVITWLDNKNIKTAEYINNKWFTSTLITQDKPSVPRVKINNKGDGIITWWYGTIGVAGDIDSVIYASLLKQTKWQQPTVISNTSKIHRRYDFAFDSNGDAILVWQQEFGRSDYKSYQNEYRNSKWQGFELVNANSTTSRSPRVSMSKNGTAIIVWNQFTPAEKSRIALKEFKAKKWGTVKTIGVGYYPEVSTNDRGDGIIVWEFNATTHKELLMSQRVNNQWTDGTLFSISDNKLNGMSYTLNMNDSGDAILNWSQSDNNVWYQYRSVYE